MINTCLFAAMAVATIMVGGYLWMRPKKKL